VQCISSFFLTNWRGRSPYRTLLTQAKRKELQRKHRKHHPTTNNKEKESSMQGDQDTRKETKKIKQKQRLKSFLVNPAIDQIHERAHLSL
jgi:fatty acid desaturase